MKLLSRSLRPHGHQAPPSMRFSRREYWSGLPFPSPGNFPSQVLNPGLPHCRQTLYCLSHQGSQKNIYFCFIDYVKVFDCVDHNKLWKILKELKIPDSLTCLLRNLYAGPEATINWAWNRPIPNRKRSMSTLYIFTLLI